MKRFFALNEFFKRREKMLASLIEELEKTEVDVDYNELIKGSDKNE